MGAIDGAHRHDTTRHDTTLTLGSFAVLHDGEDDLDEELGVDVLELAEDGPVPGLVQDEAPNVAQQQVRHVFVAQVAVVRLP